MGSNAAARVLIRQAGKFLLVLASTVFLGSEYRGTHENILKTNRPHSFDTARTAQETTRPTILLLLRVCSMLQDINYDSSK
jgi:hypothetical protein